MIYFKFQVDYRAACFCHRQLIDIGFVCSVCLSIYCKFSPICTTCDTKFKMPSVSGISKKKKKWKKSCQFIVMYHFNVKHVQSQYMGLDPYIYRLRWIDASYTFSINTGWFFKYIFAFDLHSIYNLPFCISDNKPTG